MMKYKRSILRGYDKATMPYVAKALGITIPKKKEVKHRLFQLKHVRKVKK